MGWRERSPRYLAVVANPDCLKEEMLSPPLKIHVENKTFYKHTQKNSAFDHLVGFALPSLPAEAPFKNGHEKPP
jgi:hypothetical protein